MAAAGKDEEIDLARSGERGTRGGREPCAAAAPGTGWLVASQRQREERAVSVRLWLCTALQRV